MVSRTTRTKGILDLLAQGKDVAVISDGGMPIISDPGHVLAQVLSENNIDFTVIPGANAALCALLLSGFSSEMFTFVGFLPEKNSKKEQLLSQIKLLKNTLIFHVSVHNLEKDLQFLKIHLGPRKACLVREITKKFEQKHFFNVLQDIPVNQCTSIKTPAGIFIVKVTSRQPSRNASLEEARPYIREILSGMMLKSALEQYMREILAKNPVRYFF